MFIVSVLFVMAIRIERVVNYSEDVTRIHTVDLTRATTWQNMQTYYGALEKQWNLCYSCGIPSLGTSLHLESSGDQGSVHPAVIPADYLLTRLQIIDVSTLATINPKLVLSPEVALQWNVLKQDPAEPTLLLFRFGWTDEDNKNIDVHACKCVMPGLSYELAEWIIANLSHVVGVATDTPCLESEQTREFATRTVSNILGKSGVYMIENVNMKRKIPENGCLTLAMPLKMLNANYAPTRLTAFCPPDHLDMHVVLTTKHDVITKNSFNKRIYDVNLNEILS